MQHLRFYKLIAMAGFFSLLLAGCSHLLPTQEPVTISFAHPEDPTGQYEQWAQQFHELHPHITVELVSLSSRPEQNAAHDAFLVTQFELSAILQSQAAIDLSSFIEQDETLDPADFYPAALDVFGEQGRQWALPFSVDMMMLYYNRDIFDRYQADYPQVGWRWEEFLDLALQVTDPGADLYGYAMHYDSEFAIFEPLMMIYQYGGQVFDSLQAPTRITLDEPLNIDAMTFYASLIHDYGVTPTVAEAERMGGYYPWQGVIQERFAMWTTMFSDHGGLRWPTEWRMAWGVVPLPREQAAATLGIAEGLFISSESEHPDAAWDWIAFVSRQLPPYQMPARRSLAASEQFETLVGTQVAEAGRAALVDTILVNPDLLGFEAELQAMMEAFVQIRSGDVTPEIALTTAQERIGE